MMGVVKKGFNNSYSIFIVGFMLCFLLVNSLTILYSTDVDFKEVVETEIEIDIDDQLQENIVDFEIYSLFIKYPLKFLFSKKVVSYSTYVLQINTPPPDYL